MKTLFSAVIDAKEVGTGRRLCELFMVKPFKKDYPDYYKVILEPMDLKTIEHNIRSERYANEDALLVDMKLMFRNARHYNEEGSQVGTAAMVLSGLVGRGGEKETFDLFFVFVCDSIHRFTTIQTSWRRS